MSQNFIQSYKDSRAWDFTADFHPLWRWSTGAVVITQNPSHSCHQLEFQFELSLKASFHHLPASLYFLAIILNKSIFQMLNKQLDDILIDLWNTIDYQSGTIWVMYSYNLMYTGPVFYLLSLSSIHSPLQNIKLLPGVWSLYDSHAISWPLKFISVILISRYIPLLCV